ncbi:DUF3106 domain-containing protein [Roseateles koreensis]|uniref:DUF3106 domain-containing protein n=1 Tax=Roseateles koreensis TaxID=2987526 RepID=A0ABT5KU08_9BURK|nr:DUF3106 domain-containing protein [Roseateles koreensis]MDC8786327.1 DUF3106 domain-containing protein [Roseateles koreensis]
MKVFSVAPTLLALLVTPPFCQAQTPPSAPMVDAGAADLTRTTPTAGQVLATPSLTPTTTASAAAPAAKTGGSPRAAPPTLLSTPLWQSLNRAQQTALKPLEKDWNGLDEFRKNKWLQIAARYPDLPAQEQARLQERMHDWARMSPAERQRARVGFQVAQQIKPDDRKAKWEAYQALTPEQRQALTEKAAAKQKAQPEASATAPAGHPGDSQLKSNRVPVASINAPIRSVAPSVLRAKAGASTVLINQVSGQPAHLQAGQTKVLADPSLVDSKTLLPKHVTLPATPIAPNAPVAPAMASVKPEAGASPASAVKP